MRGGSQQATAFAASFLLALLALLASPVLAEPKRPTDKDKQDKQLAGDLVKKAIARSQAGDHGAAIEIYLQAFAIVPNSLLLSNIGAEYQQSDEPEEALRYFCMYLNKDPTGTNAPYASSQARLLQSQLGNKHVDDDDVCAPPKPGPRKPPKQPPEPPPSSPSIPEQTPPPPSGNTTLKYVGVGTGIAGLVAAGVGLYAGIQAKAISDELTNHDKTQSWPDNIRQIQQRGQDYENLQIGALITGGVLVTTGAILYIVSRPDESPKRSSDKAALTVAPTRHGVTVFGRF
ncbi:MAG TPA: hypothetical protein VHN14_17095 [Kofleriaceae bacterium]|jgi:tetratricopeptide (TPR) repeat protein|nr:hypothetical protein [Kofleriaceae bacterium]